MAKEQFYIIVSGLPASGKSTVGQALSEALNLPLIDKDVILESLFASLGIGDNEWRNKLSRASDTILWQLAASAHGAVLVNWWHRDTIKNELRQLDGTVVEVFCDCPADVAHKRFIERKRHRGHLDAERLAENQIATQQPFDGPLGVGDLQYTVDTTKTISIHAIVKDMKARYRLT
jgi:predicted kinase